MKKIVISSISILLSGIGSMPRKYKKIKITDLEKTIAKAKHL